MGSNMDKESKKAKKKEEKTEVIEEFKPRKKKVRVLSFDAYFQLLLKEKKSIQKHHKAAMRKYAELRGISEASKEEFDRVFRIY